MASHLWPLQMFDPTAPFAVVERRLPHWTQAGTVCFLTWRTNDSLPSEVLDRWYIERKEWLRQHVIDTTKAGWRERFHLLPDASRREFTRTFSRRWHRHLDDGHGACVLRKPAIAKIVADSLHHFDGIRYDLVDFVVMPNHVHLLAAFVDEDGMLSQCDSWKHYTARRINQALGTTNRFWQQDGFDHLVRSFDHFEAFRRYIADNPNKAGLKVGEYLHYSKAL